MSTAQDGEGSEEGAGGEEGGGGAFRVTELAPSFKVLSPRPHITASLRISRPAET